MNVLKAKAIGAAFAMSAEAAGVVDVLAEKCHEAGCDEASRWLNTALHAIAKAGETLMQDMQGLSGEHNVAAVDVAVARLSA